MKIAIVLLPLLLLPINYALDCSKVEEDIGFCNDIVNSNLIESEKQLLIAEAIYKENNYPDHSFIYDWNTKIKFTEAPYGVKTKGNGFIRDAWLKIITVMPSVIDKKLLNNGYGEVLTAFNYKVKIPSNYYSPGYPSTNNGDCKREYYLIYDNNWLDVYLNGEIIGNEKLLSFNTKEDMHFKAKLRIQTNTEIKHYHWHTWCCARKKGSCTRYCHDCEYSHTDRKQDRVDLEDHFYAEYYAPDINPEFKVIDQYYGTTKGYLDIDNYTSVSLSFEDSYYKYFNYYYNLNTSYLPYNVLTLNAYKHKKEEFDNINVKKINNTFEFIVKNVNDCNIEFLDHFYFYSKDCDLSYIPIDLSVGTDKLTYFENETIKVQLKPKNKDIEVSYGSDKIIAKDNAEFKAVYPANRIKAKLGDKETDRVIHIKKRGNYVLLYNLSTFSGICYLIYCVLKKCFYFI